MLKALLKELLSYTDEQQQRRRDGQTIQPIFSGLLYLLLREV